ncbi:MAG: acyltransferase [Fuscovulum sp.]|jgi:surface polysaccharide O-acyltransferase-like enzyme|nr:MAG: acyltransferase [Fuscovulum sp.]
MPRIHSIDVLKLIIAAGVVWAHATLLTLQGGVVAYVLGQGLVRTVVPTFAVVSGFLFHSTFHHGRARAWLIRLGLFYLLWTVLYLPVWWPQDPTLGTVVQDLIFGPIHLWYMAALMLALVVLRVVLLLAGDDRRGRRWLIWLGLIFLLCGTTLQGVDFFSDATLSMHTWRNGVFFEFPFVVIGYLVADRIRRRGMGWLPSAGQAWAVLGGLALLRLGEAALSLDLFGLSIFAPPEFPFLTAAFALMILLVALRTEVPPVPVNIAFLSMMIYFLHFIVLLAALRLGVTQIWALMGLGLGLPVLAGLFLLGMGQWLHGRMPAAWHRRLYGSAGLKGGMDPTLAAGETEPRRG